MPMRAVVPSPDPEHRHLLRASLPLNLRAYLTAAATAHTTFLTAVSASDATVFEAMNDIVTRVADRDEKNVARAAFRAAQVALLVLPIHDAGRARQRLEEHA